MKRIRFSGWKYVVWWLLLPVLAAGADCYFQQEVNYVIRVRLLPELNRLEGRETLFYHNNSPDTLNFLYFHLYMNRLPNARKAPPAEEKDRGWQEVIRVISGFGRELPHRNFGSVMKVNLARPLPPGDSLKLYIRFNTHLPPAGMRFGYYGDHFDVGNWYPVPAVYDRYGWHADQHLQGEFYQEWGNFVVNIVVPRGFVVGGSGRLLNREALPDSVEYPYRRITYHQNADSDSVVYRFVAPRVHDFAWTADPELVFLTTYQDSVKINFLIQPYQMDTWKGQMAVARQAVKWLQKLVGPYPYPELTVVDGYIKAGGIEYPNLVIINDFIQQKRELSATIVHEIAHQWFYGILANNQTRYGWMDEGFATYFENLIMEKIEGSATRYIQSPPGIPGRFFGYHVNRWEDDRLSYLDYMRSGHPEPINRHFDWFRHDPFTPYYQNMSLVITQLNYVLGDSLFWRGMRQYYRDWRFRHPYPENLQRSFERVYGQPLDWFFDEWLNTTWTCDYGIKKVSGAWREEGSEPVYHSRLVFRRERPIAMPLDFRVYLADGSTRDYRIPLTSGDNFPDSTDAGITPWLFNNNEKTVELNFPVPVKRVRLNPRHRLLDVNPFNDDSRRWFPLRLYWLHRQYLEPLTTAYTATVFPLAFYNGPDGLQLGLRTRGNFADSDYRHSARLLLGLKSLRPAFELNLEQPLYGIDPRLKGVLALSHAAGRSGAGAWLSWSEQHGRRRTNLVFGARLHHIFDAGYALLPVQKGTVSLVEAGWSTERWNRGFLPVGWRVSLHGESSSFGSDWSYQRWQARARARVPFFFSQKLTLRLFAGGQYGAVPALMQFRYGGAPAAEFYRHPYLRAAGTLPARWWDRGHLFLPGGGNLTSLAGSAGLPFSYLGGFGARLTLGNPLNLTLVYVPYLSDVNLSGFFSAALAGRTLHSYRNPLAEAGITVSLTRLPFLFHYMDIEQIHVDFPLWVNSAIDPHAWKFRWALRIDIRRFY